MHPLPYLFVVKQEGNETKTWYNKDWFVIGYNDNPGSFWQKIEYSLKGLKTTSAVVTLVGSISSFFFFFALGLADVFFFGDLVALHGFWEWLQVFFFAAGLFAFGLAQFFPSASFFATSLVAYFGLSAFSLAVFLPLRASCLPWHHQFCELNLQSDPIATKEVNPRCNQSLWPRKLLVLYAIRAYDH